MGSKIMNYAFLFSNTQGKMKSPVNSIQLSKLGTKSVQTQLRAAGIDTNSKQYKTVISQMMKNGNGMMLFCTLDDAPLVRLNDGVSA